MADKEGKLIAGELAPSPAPHAPTSAERMAMCHACGGFHGGVGAGINCLKDEVTRLRSLLVAHKIPGAYRRSGT